MPCGERRFRLPEGSLPERDLPTERRMASDRITKRTGVLRAGWNRNRTIRGFLDSEGRTIALFDTSLTAAARSSPQCGVRATRMPCHGMRGALVGNPHINIPRTRRFHHGLSDTHAYQA